MTRWLSSLLLLLTLAAVAGCGTRELGPANPDDTPKVDEAEIQQKIQETMPEQYRQQYRQK